MGLFVPILALFVSVLPSFSGNVPAAMKKIYPSANITRLGDWYFTLFIMVLMLSFKVSLS